MEVKKTSSGSDVFDKLLEGGFENDIVTTIYGPAGSGKTTIGMLCAIHVAKQGKKTIFVDTEGGFSGERFGQLCAKNPEIMKSVLILRPINFKEQMKTIFSLKDHINERIGLVVVDTISMLYRAEISETKDIKQVNNELGLQISWLIELARRHKIPVIIANQVYADFEAKDKVKMVGGDILRYSSKCLIEMLNYLNKRKAVIVKHRSLPERKEVVFEIVGDGFREVK